MKNFFYFLKGDHQIEKLLDIKSKLKFTVIMLPVMFLVVIISSLLQINFVKWGLIDQVKSPGMIPDYMKSMSAIQIIMEIAILAPLLEETAFRGPLQNHPRWFRICIFSFSYLIICRIAGLNFYKISSLTIIVLFVSAFSFLISGKVIRKVICFLNQPPFRGILIWCSALAFGLWHYYNFDFSQTGFLTIVISLLPFTLNGLLFSYVAVKNGLTWSIILHIANNVWPLIVWF